MEGKVANKGNLPPWIIRASSHWRTLGGNVEHTFHSDLIPRDKRTEYLYTNSHLSLDKDFSQRMLIP